jgi:hypothetical protein
MSRRKNELARAHGKTMTNSIYGVPTPGAELLQSVPLKAYSRKQWLFCGQGQKGPVPLDRYMGRVPKGGRTPLPSVKFPCHTDPPL